MLVRFDTDEFTLEHERFGSAKLIAPVIEVDA
jgi:hypothetical protein